MRSLDNAARSVADDLFENDESLERPDTITRLQESKAIRLIVFVFGALPQAVKLWAMRGIVRTQICALLFLGSFTVIEAIMLWLEKYRATIRDRRTVHERPNKSNKLEMIRGLLICTGHSSAVCLVAATSAELAKSKTILFLAVLTGTLYAGMTDSVYIFLSKALHEVLASQHAEAFDSLMPSLQESDDHWMQRRCWVVCSMLVCGIMFQMTALFLNSDYYSKTAVIFIENLVLGFLISDPDESVSIAGGNYSVNLRPGGYILFMLLQLLAAVRIYAFDYDPTDTYKPGWTNKLG